MAALLSGQDTAGSLVYQMGRNTWLGSYALVPAAGWGVIIEQPLTMALAGAYAGRDLAFLLVLWTALLAGLIGAFAADRLTAPLAVLSEAVARLAHGDRSAPLPHSSTTELARLGDAFGVLRDTLAAQTTERERAELALSASVAEARKLALVASRTHNAVLIVDADMRIEWVNESFTRMTGYTLDEALGKTARAAACAGRSLDVATIAADARRRGPWRAVLGGDPEPPQGWPAVLERHRGPADQG